MKLSQIDPLDYPCCHCKEQILDDGDPVGVEWQCGHLNCCSLKPSKSIQYCIYEECPNSREPGKIERSGWYRAKKSQRVQLKKFEKAIKKQVQKWCPEHNDMETEDFAAPNHSPLGNKLRCSVCFEDGPRPANYVEAKEASVFFARNFLDFRRSYTSFDRFLEERGVDLGFRASLDQVAADLVTDFASLSHLDIFRGSEHLQVISQSDVNGVDWAHIDDLRLVRLGDLLDRTVKSFGFHEQKVIIQKLSDFVDQFIEVTPESRVIVPAGNGPSELTQELRNLWAKKWFVFHPALAKLPPMPNLTRVHPLENYGARTVHVRQKNKLAFDRKRNPWAYLAQHSTIFTQSDISRLIGQFQGLRSWQKLIAVTSQATSPTEFHTATAQKPNTLLLIRTSEHRFGYFSPNGLVCNQTGLLEGAFFFSLDTGRVFPFRFTDFDGVHGDPESWYFQVSTHDGQDFNSQFKEKSDQRELTS